MICLDTNIVETLQGSVSISLDDVGELGRLPIIGELYDEVIPGQLELTAIEMGCKFLSETCEHLFAAFTILFGFMQKSLHILVTK